MDPELNTAIFFFTHPFERFYQQDGATSHTARITMELLRDLFPQQVKSRNGDVDWPPRSPDLTDYFF